MESARCYHCGQPIRFVPMGGVVHSFHKNGRICPGAKRHPKQVASGEPLPFPIVFPAAFGGAVQQYICSCRNQVMRVQHKDGFLQFDQLEWPWKRHMCTATTVADYGVDYLRLKLKEKNSSHPRLAIVAGAQKGWGTNPIYLAAVQELCDGGSRFCLRLHGEELPSAVKRLEKIEAGGLVALNRNVEPWQLMTTSGFDFQCLDSQCWPEELGIPSEWIDPDNPQI